MEMESLKGLTLELTARGLTFGGRTSSMVSCMSRMQRTYLYVFFSYPEWRRRTTTERTRWLCQQLSFPLIFTVSCSEILFCSLQGYTKGKTVNSNIIRLRYLRTSLVAQMVKHLPTMRETWVWSLGQEDPLENKMATHSSILAWKIPWTEEPGRLPFTGSQRVEHDWVTSLQDTWIFIKQHYFTRLNVDTMNVY